MDADPELPTYKTLSEMPQLVPEIGPASPPEVEMVKCWEYTKEDVNINIKNKPLSNNRNEWEVIFFIAILIWCKRTTILSNLLELAPHEIRIGILKEPHKNLTEEAYETENQL